MLKGDVYQCKFLESFMRMELFAWILETYQHNQLGFVGQNQKQFLSMMAETVQISNETINFAYFAPFSMLLIKPFLAIPSK